jgi:phenylalanyl-tRNA synthetase beta chain
VRHSRPGERAHLLFQAAPIDVPEGTLVIADAASILAIAGVIGCEGSKTTAATRNVWLESATFDPVAVRKAARALGVHTDASARFERGADPERVLTGAGRVVTLLEQTGAWRRTGPTRDTGWSEPRSVVPFDEAAVERVLGMPLGDARERLERLGFERRPGALQVPPWRRWDVTQPADLWEEVARARSYDAHPASLPSIDRGGLPSKAEQTRARIDAVLVHRGFHELVTDGFYARSVRDWLLGGDDTHPLWAHVESTNALDRSYALLKNNTLAQAVEAVGINSRWRTLDVKAFEWTRTFHPTGTGGPGRDQPPCVERHVLWGVLSGMERPRTWAEPGRAVDLHAALATLADIFRAAGLDVEFASDVQHPAATALHPGRRAAVCSAGSVVGVVGEVHPTVLSAARLKGVAPIWFEVLAEALLHGNPVARRFEDAPDWLAMERDLAFTLPPGLPAGRVRDTLRAASPGWVRAIAPTDRYVHGDGTVTVTFGLVLDNPPEAERTTAQVNALLDSLVAAVTAELGPAGVRLR